MANTSKLSISELDFDTIKAALKSYLQSQSEFSDYDFEGSGLTTILNLLTYNTHYLSYYLNMVANEMFLDSADLRESVVSIAKQLGYIPRSRVAATAIVNLTLTPPNTPPPPSTTTINKYTKFNSSLNGKNYVFITDSAVTVNYDETNNRYVAPNVLLREGTPFTYKYTVDSSNPTNYVIPTSGADTQTILVRVQKSSQNNLITVYTLADDITALDGNSTVYFLQEVEGSQYEIYFGDGVLGKALEDGNIVYIDYITCNGDTVNYCNVFTAASKVSGYTCSVQTVSPAYGGSEREDIESVRFAAPKNYEAQNRAVTVEDYKTLITRDYPNVDSVAVWGGEDEDPPQYGKVFLSLKPVSGYVITEATKQLVISQTLKRRNIVSIIPIIEDPEYIFIKVNTLVKFDAENTTRTADEIAQLVFSAIHNFGENEIGKFDRILRYSKLTGTIDGVEPSVTNNLTTLQIEKRFVPRLNVTDNYNLQFGNTFVPGTLSSTAFVDTLDPSYVSGDKYYFDDDGNGIIRIYKFVGTTRRYTKSTAGIINYFSGTITLTSFRPNDVIDSSKELHITVQPAINDITPVRNNIIVLEDADINITMTANNPILL